MEDQSSTPSWVQKKWNQLQNKMNTAESATISETIFDSDQSYKFLSMRLTIQQDLRKSLSLFH